MPEEKNTRAETEQSGPAHFFEYAIPDSGPGHIEPGNIPYLTAREYYKKGVAIGLVRDKVSGIIDSDIVPSKAIRGYLIGNVLLVIPFAGAFVLAFLVAWWLFFPGFALWFLLWKVNMKRASRAILLEALNNKRLYDAIAEADGWRFVFPEGWETEATDNT